MEIKQSEKVSILKKQLYVKTYNLNCISEPNYMYHLHPYIDIHIHIHTT